MNSVARGQTLKNDQQRRDHPDPADCVQHVRAGGEPKQGWRKPEAGHPELARHCFEIFVGWKNPLRADEPTNLKYQREEGRKVNQAERAQKDPARKQTVRRAVLRIEPPANEGRRAQVHGGRIISRMARRRLGKAGNHRGNKRRRRTAIPACANRRSHPAPRGEARSAHAKSNDRGTDTCSAPSGSARIRYVSYSGAPLLNRKLQLAGGYIVHQHVPRRPPDSFRSQNAATTTSITRSDFDFPAEVNRDASLFRRSMFPKAQISTSHRFRKVTALPLVAEVDPLTKFIRAGFGQGRQIRAVIDVETFQLRQCRRNVRVKWIERSARRQQDSSHPAFVCIDDAQATSAATRHASRASAVRSRVGRDRRLSQRVPARCGFAVQSAGPSAC